MFARASFLSVQQGSDRRIPHAILVGKQEKHASDHKNEREFDEAWQRKRSEAALDDHD